MGAPDDPSDSLMTTLIDVVRDNTEKTVAAHNETIATRNSMNATAMQLFQRIVDIERQLLLESRERPARQRQLDESISKINTRLDNQDTTLEGQDKKLDTLFEQQRKVIHSGRWRTYLLIGILLAFLSVGYAFMHWIGWI